MKTTDNVLGWSQKYQTYAQTRVNKTLHDYIALEREVRQCVWVNRPEALRWRQHWPVWQVWKNTRKCHSVSYKFYISGVQSQRKVDFMSEKIEFVHPDHVEQEQIQVYVVYEGSVVWISGDWTQVSVCSYTGLTSRLNHLRTNPLPRRLNSLWLDLDQCKSTSLGDFGSQRLMAAILPVQDLGMAWWQVIESLHFVLFIQVILHC